MKRMLSVLLAMIFIFMMCPNSAHATNHLETEYIRDYETFVIRLREGAAERRDPFVLYVIETKDTAGKIAKVDYFDLVEHTGNPYQGDAFRWEIDSPYNITKTLISDTNGEKLYECTIELGWKTNAQEEASVRARIGELIQELGVSRDMNDYEKTKIVYDYICNHVKYGYTVIDGSSSISYTSYAALILGKAVCQGYSVLLYKMLNAVGVDNRIVAGTRNGSNHGWNLVCIDGQYYFADATWDAGKAPDNYQYFLKSVNSTSFTSYKMFPVYQNIANKYPLSNVDYISHECNFGPWTLQTPATCTEDGLEMRMCNCGKSETRVIPMLGHSWGDWEQSECFTPIRFCQNTGCDSVEYQTMTKNIHKCREEDRVEGREGCRVCLSVFDRLHYLISICEKHFGMKFVK